MMKAQAEQDQYSYKNMPQRNSLQIAHSHRVTLGEDTHRRIGTFDFNTAADKYTGYENDGSMV